jgi:hypothetical protein
MTLWRIRATIDDRPGFLAVLAASLALRSVNIMSVQVHTTESGAVDDFLVDAPDALTAAELLDAVRRGRGRDPWVALADVRGLVDEPTRMLALAARVVAEHEALEEALGVLLGSGCEISWRADGGGQRDGYAASAMQLHDPSGGMLFIQRTEPAFTPAEYARAHALVGLARIASKTP